MTRFFAAIDLGSNSFRISIIEKITEPPGYRICYQEKETVRLAINLHVSPVFSDEVCNTALSTLEMFRQQLQRYPSVLLRIVATSAFRQAQNAHTLCQSIRALMGVEVEILTGQQEATYIYQGVYALLPEPERLHPLVIDIGGGSTECIIGQHENIIWAHSFSLGCLTHSRQFFTTDIITVAQWESALNHVYEQFLPLKSAMQTLGWQKVFGSSGTIKAIFAILQSYQGHSDKITALGMKHLIQQALIQRSMQDIARLQGIKPQRVMVFPGGASILYGLLEILEIEEMQPANGALRMGILLEMMK